ncbi:hypothetical protein bcgnr5378_05170 [Bacillus cereus]
MKNTIKLNKSNTTNKGENIMNTIKFLGLNAAFEKGFKNNGFFFKGDALFLLDMSSENFAGMRDKGLFSKVKEIHCIITHTHGDHVSGIGDLALYSYYSVAPGFSKKLKVYAPQPIFNDVSALLRIFGATSEHVDAFSFEVNEENTVNGVTFKPLSVTHTPVLECFAYEIILGEDTIYYSGDSNIIPTAVLEKHLNGEYNEFYQDTCIAEYPGNVHLPLSTLQELVGQAYRSNVFLMHLDNGFPIQKSIELGFQIPSIEK